MPKLPVLTAREAETIMLKAGFVLVRTRGSHRIYMRESQRVVLPYHAGKSLHPKIVREVLDAVGA